MRLSDCVKALAVAAAMAGSAAAGAERLTVEQAVDLALEHNLRLLAAGERAGAGHDTALAAGAHLLPAVRLTEEYQHWDCDAAISLASFGEGAQCYETALAKTEAGMPPVKARFQDTNNFVASIDQPLVGLLHRGYDFAAARDNARAGDAGTAAARAQLVQAVRTAFLRYFEARALEQIAAAAVGELDEQVKVARARLKAGVITNADLLRVQVAEANARQQQIGARTQGVVTRNQLLDALGLDARSDLELVEPASLLATGAAPLPAAGEAIARAETRRPEVAQAKATRSAAAHARTARYLSLLPEVDAEGAYINTYGQLFAPPNQWFVGVRASWNIWEWGATFFQARAAGKQAAAAALELDDQRRGVAVEVANALAQTEAAKVSVDVAHEAIASAQEAYRVEQALLQAGSATTTDLLDAQAALTTARLNLARAQYALAIQRVALARVMGE